MPQIISSTKLRNNYNAVSTSCKNDGEPVYVTHNGEGDLTVMNIASFERMQNKLDFYEELLKGYKDVSQGKTRPATEVTNDLRKKYGL